MTKRKVKDRAPDVTPAHAHDWIESLPIVLAFLIVAVACFMLWETDGKLARRLDRLERDNATQQDFIKEHMRKGHRNAKAL